MARPCAGRHHPAEHSGLEPDSRRGSRHQLDELIGNDGQRHDLVPAAPTAVEMGENLGSLATLQHAECQLGHSVATTFAARVTHDHRR
jgi:hypothetical protein